MAIRKQIDTSKGKSLVKATAKDSKPVKTGKVKKSEDTIKSFRYNLSLEAGLNQYLHEIAYQNRVSMNEYVNMLIKADMEKYFKNGGTKEGWRDEEYYKDKKR